MSKEAPPEDALPLDWLITPAAAFNHPDDVLSHSGLTIAEKRAILASWASRRSRGRRHAVAAPARVRSAHPLERGSPRAAFAGCGGRRNLQRVAKRRASHSRRVKPINSGGRNAAGCALRYINAGGNRVDVANGVLTVKGQKEEDKVEKKEDFHLRERRFGSFVRSVRLPETVDADKIEAAFKNGVLKVTLPKKPEAQKPVKKIEVKGS